MYDIDYRQLALDFVRSMNMRYCQSSEYTPDMSDREAATYRAALKLLEDCFTDCPVPGVKVE